MSTSIKANGNLSVPNQNKALVTSLSNGVIKTLLIQPGTYVKKGQIIATITNTDAVEIQQQLQAANTQISLSTLEYNREKELVAGSAAPLKNVQRVDFPRLKANQIIHFTLTNNAGKEYDAVIYSIGSAFAKDTKTRPVHAVVKGYKTGLIEGMNITALISIGSSVVPAVQTTALVSRDGQDFVFMMTKNAPPKPEEKGEDAHQHKGESGEAETGKEIYFERIAIVKGASDVGYTEITPVVEFGKDAKIVTKGAFFIMAKMTNTGGH